MSDIDRSKWLDAQVGCIGSVLIKPELAGQLLADTTINDFSGPAAEVYGAISDLYSSGSEIDSMIVAKKLNGSLNDYMLQVMEVTPSAANLHSYISIVREQSKLDRVKAICLEAAYAPDLDSAADLLQSASDAIGDTPKRCEAQSMSALMLDFFERKKTRERYIQTGIRAIDSNLYLSAGDFVIIAGQPSRGKTALALQVAIRQSREYRVAFFSLETSPAKVADRIMCHMSGIPMDRIKRANLTESDWSALSQVSSTLAKDYKLDVVQAAGMTVDDMFRLAAARRYEIIYIDYLQIVTGKGSSRYDIVTNISARMHTLAQKHGILTVALSQLHRLPTAKTEEPSMSDLRESGQIEQDADAILMVYCKDKDRTDGDRVVKAAKNKEGELFALSMHWDGSRQLMTPRTSREPERTRQVMRPLPDDTPVPFDGFEQTKLE